MPLQTLEEALVCARAGAELLDKVDPGWDQEIDEERLDMAGYCGCILGQRHGNAGTGWRYVKDRALELGLPLPGMASTGFFDPCTDVLNVPIEERYASLQSAWLEVLAERKAMRCE